MEGFEAHRPQLFGIAYRMLGSAADAEDVVQDAYLKWQSAPRDDVRSERAFLSTMVTRLCLDQLASARVRREKYVGPWLPEPVRTEFGSARELQSADPPDLESISLAFLVLLQSLTPLERAVYLLHEVFDYSHAEISQILGREEASCRQLLHRAKSSVTAGRPRFAPDKQAHQNLLGKFMMAIGAGDLDGLKKLLANDVTAWSDGGGKASAATQALHGVDHVARFYHGLGKKVPPELSFAVEEINGWPALVLRNSEGVETVINLETDGQLIYGIRAVRNPDKLARL
ncbi:MAG: RNA polymerase sigma-70 factor [Myxococcales bacterium]